MNERSPRFCSWWNRDYIRLLGTCFMQVFHLGRAPRTKETLPDFLKWCRVTRHPLVFRGLTGSQRTPGQLGRHCVHVHGDIASSRLWVHGMVIHHSW